MARTFRYAPQDVAALLSEHHGVYSAVARVLGCERTTIARYVGRFAVCREAAQTAIDAVSDTAEYNLVQAVYAGDLAQSRYWLENKAHDRGYGVGRNRATLTVTPEDLQVMTDSELDALASKLAKL